MTSKLRIALGELHPRVLEAAVRGEFSLLLGSGASVGGSGGQRELPTGSTLARELVADFDLPNEGYDLTLQEAYEAALERQTSDGLSLGDYFRNRFLDTTPSDAMRLLPSMSWRRIWTLNVDDSVEQSYASASQPRQQLISLTWDDRHVDPSPGELQVVHLHGSARFPERLVFSISEYLSATVAQHAWHRIIADHYQELPFIVLGATLRGEFDLAHVVRRGSLSARVRGLPSLIVADKFPELQRQFVTKHGLVPVEMEAADFLRELRTDARSTEIALRDSIGIGESMLPVEAQTFLEQFLQLRFEAIPPKRPRDFYLGYDPTWYDILLDKDAVFGVVGEVVQSVLEPAAVPRQRLELIHGPWGTGKSTALLRVGRELLQSGLDVFLFRGDAALDTNAAIWWVTRRPNTALLIDGVADFAPEIEELLEESHRRRISITLVGVERRQRIRKIEASISAEFIRMGNSRVMSTLSDGDIASLLSTLEDQTRLGRITRWGEEARYQYFRRDHRRQLFSAMSELEGGVGFAERLASEYGNEKLTASQRDLLSYCALTYDFGYEAPLGVLSHALALPAATILDWIEVGALGDWIDVGVNGLRLRHRRMASLLLENHLTQADRYRLSFQLAVSLAPRVDRDAVYRRTLTYRIARNLLDADSVRRWVGSSAVAWYANLSPQYGWNARYWEQRALTHLKEGDYSVARSFAERAVAIHRDPFTLTTLAHVMFRQLEASLEHAEPLNVDDYLAAAEVAKAARDQARFRDDYPYTVFFDASLRILRTVTPGHSRDRVLEHVREWIHSAEESSLHEYPEYGRLIMRVKREFKRLER